jgi:hypothetical protein
MGELVLAGAYGNDAVVARLDRSGRTLLAHTVLGGAGLDAALGVTLSCEGGAWVAGRTASTDFPLSPNTLQRSWREEIVAGDRDDLASGLTLTAGGDVAVAGLTRSTGLTGAERPESTRDGDAFVTFLRGAELSPNGVCPGTKNFLGTDSNAWEDPDNWSGASLPTSTDDVCICGFNVVIGSGSQDAGKASPAASRSLAWLRRPPPAGASEIV